MISTNRDWFGQPSPPAVVSVLKECGFIHVTGLRTSGRKLTFTQEEGYIIGQKLKPEEYGRWNYNNGKAVIVTLGGEVWLGTGVALKRMKQTTCPTLSQICPHGEGGFVPCSNGETISLADLLARLTDSYVGLDAVGMISETE